MRQELEEHLQEWKGRAEGQVAWAGIVLYIKTQMRIFSFSPLSIYLSIHSCYIQPGDVPGPLLTALLCSMSGSSCRNTIARGAGAAEGDSGFSLHWVMS